MNILVNIDDVGDDPERDDVEDEKPAETLDEEIPVETRGGTN